MARIFLLTFSNQYNAYNIMLQLMASEISCITSTTKTTHLLGYSLSYHNNNVYNPIL